MEDNCTQTIFVIQLYTFTNKRAKNVFQVERLIGLNLEK